MQAQDLFPQVRKLSMAERLALLNFLVQLIQQEGVRAETEQRLSDNSTANTAMATPTKTDTDEVKQTVLERMGGMPQHLLSVGDLSDRDIRRQVVAERIQHRYDHP